MEKNLCSSENTRSYATCTRKHLAAFPASTASSSRVPTHPVLWPGSPPEATKHSDGLNAVIHSRANVEAGYVMKCPFAQASTASPFHYCHLGVSPLPPAAV